MMLKSAVFGISVAAIAAAEVINSGFSMMGPNGIAPLDLDIGSGNGRCHTNHPYPPGTAPLSCEDDVTFEDVNGSCGAPDDPCLSTMDGLTTGDPRCNNCYKVTYSYEGLSDGEALELCKDGVCPAYTAEVYIQVKDFNDGSHDGAKFEMTQNAWSKLCPYVCAHSQTEICVQDAATCEKYGPIPDNPLHMNGYDYVEPGSCRASMKPIKWEQLEKCGDSGGNPPIDPSSSSTTVAPEPSTTPTDPSTTPTDPSSSSTTAPTDPSTTPTDPSSSSTTAPTDPSSSSTTAPTDPSSGSTTAPIDPSTTAPPGGVDPSSSTGSGEPTTTGEEGTTGPIEYDNGKGEARCNVHNLYPPGSYPLACGHDIVQTDLDGTCGGPEKPCVTSMLGVTYGDDRCGTCYKVTYNRTETTDGDANQCKGGVCPGYSSVVYLQVEDAGSADVKFGMTQNAWSKLCPYTCMGTEECVQNAEDCILGVIDDLELKDPNSNFTYIHPGSCHVSKKPVEWFQLEKCGDAEPPTSAARSKVVGASFMAFATAAVAYLLA